MDCFAQVCGCRLAQDGEGAGGVLQGDAGDYPVVAESASGDLRPLLDGLVDAFGARGGEAFEGADACQGREQCCEFGGLGDLAGCLRGDRLLGFSGEVDGGTGGRVEGCLDAGLKPRSLDLPGGSHRCRCAADEVADRANDECQRLQSTVATPRFGALAAGERLQEDVQLTVLGTRVEVTQKPSRNSGQQRPGPQVRIELPRRIPRRPQAGGLVVEPAQQVVNAGHRRPADVAI